VCSFAAFTGLQGQGKYSALATYDMGQSGLPGGLLPEWLVVATGAQHQAIALPLHCICSSSETQGPEETVQFDSGYHAVPVVPVPEQLCGP
jgi:hypothetical protein